MSPSRELALHPMGRTELHNYWRVEKDDGVILPLYRDRVMCGLAALARVIFFIGV